MTTSSLGVYTDVAGCGMRGGNPERLRLRRFGGVKDMAWSRMVLVTIE
jgi:hypothetical protein